MGAENNLGEMLSQLAIKDAGPIAELTPEQSKLVNTERCFPAIEAIVKFAQENQVRHNEKDPDHKESVDAADAAKKWADAAKGEIEGVGIARIRNIARGKTSLQNTGSMGLTAAADRKINPLIDRSITQDLTEFYNATGIDSPNRIARYTEYSNIEIADIPANHDLLVAVIKSKKEQKKGVAYNNGNSSRKTVVTAPVSLPNTICIETTIETYTTVDNGNGNSSTSVLTGQDTSFDLVCFSDAEWERAQLAVDKPDYAARYAYLKSKLSTNDQGEPSLRNIEQNIAVNGDLALRGEISLRDAKLPALVSAPEGKFIAWRNPARAGQIELIPTTSKDLVERAMLVNGYPGAAITRLQGLLAKEEVLRNGMRETEITADVIERMRANRTVLDKWNGLIRDQSVLKVGINAIDKSGNVVLNQRDFRIVTAQMDQLGNLAVKIEYSRTGQNIWKNAKDLAFYGNGSTGVSPEDALRNMGYNFVGSLTFLD